MDNKKKYFHSVTLSRDKCVGCTRCVRVCPTEAIRVRNQKAIIEPSKCIDCGQCIDVCPTNAITIKHDSLKDLKRYKYNLAIISASYAGQFSEDIGHEKALRALYHIGFDDVAEQAMITHITAEIIRDYIRIHPKIRPILSSSCPATVRLIQVRFPSLLTNLLHIESPMSILAKYYRDKIVKEKRIKPEEIGIFLIVPSAAQVTAVHQPEGTYKHLHDGAIAISEVYTKVMDNIKRLEKDEREIVSYANGLSWALAGQEAEEIAADDIKTLAVCGIHNVIDILSNIESHRLDQYDYIELRNCPQGCVGGSLNVENPFVAENRIRSMVKSSQKKNIDDDYFFNLYREGYFDVMPLEPRSIMELDKDFKKAISKMKKVKEIVAELPGLDCGVCGSPTCKALAEDIAKGEARLEDCIIRSRRQKKQDKG